MTSPTTTTTNSPPRPRRFGFCKQHTFRKAGYRPSDAQLEFHNSDARFRLLIAGSRFGKSLAAAMEVVHQALSPHCIIWIVGPTYALALKEFHFAISGLRKVDSQLIASVTGEFSDNRSAVARLRNGTVIVTKSAGNPTSLLGEEVDLMVLAEASRIDADAWRRHLRPRLGTRCGHAIVPTTPDGADDWVHEMFSQGLEEGEAACETASFGPYAVIENPHFPKGEFELARRTLPINTFNEQYLGMFVRGTGLVYPEFNRRTHVFDDRDLPGGWRDWPVWRGIDFGYRNPFVCVWMAKDDEGRWWVLDELYEREMLVEVAARMIIERSAGMRIRATIADHDAEDRATLARHGVRTQKANKAVMPGVGSVRRALMPIEPDSESRATARARGSEWKLTECRPGLLVHRRCRNVEMEFEGYAWDDADADGDAVEVSAELHVPRREDAPKKYADHAMDAVRYVVHTVDGRRRHGDARWMDVEVVTDDE
ncbi:MAG: terminase family protein [Planctomycetota bacterium]